MSNVNLARKYWGKAWEYYFDGECDRAIAAGRKAMELNPAFARVHWVIGNAFLWREPRRRVLEPWRRTQEPWRRTQQHRRRAQEHWRDNTRAGAPYTLAVADYMVALAACTGALAAQTLALAEYT